MYAENRDRICCGWIETSIDVLPFPFALYRFMRYKIQLINLLAYLLCTHITMCVCMNGPARVNVMYLYMIPHTCINLDYFERRARASALKKSRFVAWCFVKGQLARRCSRVNSNNRIVTMTGMITGVNHIHRHDVQRVNNKVDRIGLIRWLYVHRVTSLILLLAGYVWQMKTIVKSLKFQCAMIAILRYLRLRGR